MMVRLPLLLIGMLLWGCGAASQNPIASGAAGLDV